MESQDGSWASLNQSDAQGSSSSMQLSRDSFSTSDSHQVDVDLLGGDLALSDDSSEGESEEVDSDSDSEESEEEQHGDPDQDVKQSDRKTKEEVKLDQPFKQGWVRECLMDGKKVLRVYYLSPAIGPSKVRRRMRDKRSIAQFLSKSNCNSSLLPTHFSFKPRPLMPAAGDEEMLEAKSLEAPFSFKTDAIFHYWQEEKAGDEGRPGRCKLCGSNKPPLPRKHFRMHMQTDHLPDETCDICGGKFRPRAFRQHWETCTGSAPCRSRAAQYKKLLRFWVEDLEGSRKNRRKGRCLLCPARDQLVCHQAFVQHMQRYHLLEAECSKCGKLMTRTEAKQHELLCPADGQSKAGGHSQSNFDSKASATDALSMANPNPSEPAAVGGHPNHTTQKSNQGSNSEGGTSPDRVSDLLRSSSPEPRADIGGEASNERRAVIESPASVTKAEIGNVMEESVHIQESPNKRRDVKEEPFTSGIHKGEFEKEGTVMCESISKILEVKISTEDLKNLEEVPIIFSMKLEGYPVRKLRLKSTMSVGVAMRKFATASGFSHKELRFFWQGKKLSGKETACSLNEHLEISVEQRAG